MSTYSYLYISKLLHDIMDPFTDLSPEDKKYVESLCAKSHIKFIDHVKKSRGNRLKDDKVIFSGEVFTGEEAK